MVGALDRWAKAEGGSLRQPRRLFGPADRATALVVGYGPVGRAVVEQLLEDHVSPVIVEMNVDTVLELQAAGIRAYYGDATGSELLVQAGAFHAEALAYRRTR